MNRHKSQSSGPSYPTIALTLFFLISLWLTIVPLTTAQTDARIVSFPVVFHWPAQKGASSYRLQIAADEKFHDIFFDGQVKGQQYKTSQLPPGYYFWRVAPAGSYYFMKPSRFFVSGGAVISTPVQAPRRSNSNHLRRR